MTALKNKTYSYVILGTVFFTGAAVLVVEITATRVFAPFFGNTVYTVSSVISVILAALSFGYYFGGKLADKRPNVRIFYFLIFAGGILLLLSQALYTWFLPRFSGYFSIEIGPLISSIAFFFLPSLLFGTLSPFAIQLLHVAFPHEGVGSVSGKVFFWSTLGSILGGIAAGFFLIPFFGVFEIILGVSIALITLGFVALTVLRPISLKFLILLFPMIVTLMSFSFYQNLNENYLYAHDGMYENIKIYDGIYNGFPTRFLILNGMYAGGMRLDSDKLAFDYTEYYKLHRLFTPEPERMLVLGAGSYSIPKGMLADAPTASVDVADIEPKLFELGKQFFRVEENPRLTNFVKDGRRFLQDSKNPYDVIFSDVYFSFYGIPEHFTTKEFFALVKSRLSDKGIFVANIIGSLEDVNPSFALSEFKTMKEAFPQSHLFAMEPLDLKRIQNFIFIGLASDEPVDLYGLIAKEKENDPFFRHAAGRLVDVNSLPLEGHLVFTDNYAPIEHYLSRLIKQIRI